MNGGWCVSFAGNSLLLNARMQNGVLLFVEIAEETEHITIKATSEFKQIAKKLVLHIENIACLPDASQEQKRITFLLI